MEWHLACFEAFMSSSELTPEIFLDANMNAARAMGGEDNFSELAKPRSPSSFLYKVDRL